MKIRLVPENYITQFSISVKWSGTVDLCDGLCMHKYTGGSGANQRTCSLGWCGVSDI